MYWFFSGSNSPNIWPSFKTKRGEEFRHKLLLPLLRMAASQIATARVCRSSIKCRGMDGEEKQFLQPWPKLGGCVARGFRGYPDCLRYAIQLAERAAQEAANREPLDSGSPCHSRPSSYRDRWSGVRSANGYFQACNKGPRRRLLQATTRVRAEKKYNASALSMVFLDRNTNRPRLVQAILRGRFIFPEN